MYLSTVTHSSLVILIVILNFDTKIFKQIYIFVILWFLNIISKV